MRRIRTGFIARTAETYARPWVPRWSAPVIFSQLRRSVSTLPSYRAPGLFVASAARRATPPLTVFEDRRLWSPYRSLLPAGTLGSRSARRLVEVPRAASGLLQDPFPSLRLGFAVPKRVVLCVRRKTRREVIHARGFVRKGASSRVRRRNQFSEVTC